MRIRQFELSVRRRKNVRAFEISVQFGLDHLNTQADSPAGGSESGSCERDGRLG